jgi:hypothetical protein
MCAKLRLHNAEGFEIQGENSLKNSLNWLKGF